MAQLGCKELGLLEIRQKDLRVKLQNLIERSRTALGMPDDKEVGDSSL
jgi:hypothetical protein